MLIEFRLSGHSHALLNGLAAGKSGLPGEENRSRYNLPGRLIGSDLAMRPAAFPAALKTGTLGLSAREARSSLADAMNAKIAVSENRWGTLHRVASDKIF